MLPQACLGASAQVLEHLNLNNVSHNSSFAVLFDVFGVNSSCFLILSMPSFMIET